MFIFIKRKVWLHLNIESSMITAAPILTFKLSVPRFHKQPLSSICFKTMPCFRYNTDYLSTNAGNSNMASFSFFLFYYSIYLTLTKYIFTGKVCESVYSGSSIIRTLRGNQKSFELWSVRVMELQFNSRNFHGASAFVRIKEQFELWRFELWSFHCIYT